MKILLLLSTTVILSLAIQRHRKCPTEYCRCDIYNNKKRIICNKVEMYRIPTPSMDKDISILIITAPPDRRNVLTIGRIFLDFTALEEVHIMHSYVPAIGDSSFWPGDKLKILNLSHNNITILRDSDFNGLVNLKVLNISDNNIATTPSAPFSLLVNLTTLLIARNKLQILVPRFFFQLGKLTHLDLSGNPLSDLDSDVMSDVKSLKVLHVANCKLSKLHSTFYQQIPNLEELDLRNNLMKELSSEQFRHVTKLRTLHVQGNLLKVLVEKTFDKNNFDYLDLSDNQIEDISPCAFCYASITHLDLSVNQLTNLHQSTMLPLNASLEFLDLSSNILSPKHVTSNIRTLHNIRVLQLVGMQLSELSADTFTNSEKLEILNLSHNNIDNVTSALFEPLKSIQKLDLSQNEFNQLQPSVLSTFTNLTQLKVLCLHSNPWSCDPCDVIPFIKWMNTSHLYNTSCQSAAGHQNCLRCFYPPYLKGRDIHTLTEEELGNCEIIPPNGPSRNLTDTSKIGLIVATTIITVLVVTIIIIIIIYKRHGAVYYTREDDRPRNSIFDARRPTMGGTNGYPDEKKVYVSTLGRIEEGRENVASPITSIG